MFKPKAHSIGFRPKSVAIQGQFASFSHQTVTHIWEEFNDAAIRCYDDFEGPLKAVVNDEVDAAVIPYRNTIAGNVPYVHNLLGKKELSISGEFHLGVQFFLLGVPGTKMMDVKEMHSHTHALGQVRGYRARHPNIEAVVNPDTGGAAKLISELEDPTKVAVASAFAGQLYGLEKLGGYVDKGMQDDKDPITRFFVFTKDNYIPEMDRDNERPPRMRYVTNLYVKPHRKTDRAETQILRIFEDELVDRHEPSLDEFYGQDFQHDGYSCEFMGHVDEPRVKRAMQRLKEICSEVNVIGCYDAHHFHRFPKRAGPKVDGSYRYGL